MILINHLRKNTFLGIIKFKYDFSRLGSIFYTIRSKNKLSLFHQPLTIFGTLLSILSFTENNRSQKELFCYRKDLVDASFPELFLFYFF